MFHIWTWWENRTGTKFFPFSPILKLFGPIYLVLPGIIAVALFAGQGIKGDHAYGMLVNKVLPAPLTGFFAAVMIGAVITIPGPPP